MQQPLEQYVPIGHVGLALVQVCSPLGQVAPVQLGGSMV